MTFDAFAAVVGWIGTGMLLLAYWLVSTERVTGHSPVYQLLNIAGSIGLGLAAVAGGVWSSVALNAIWGVIGAVALVRALHHRTPARRPAGDARDGFDAPRAP
ncbi:MAG: hypothetical protein IPJ14_11425 [Kineosporiaceae bacterium]|jgi:hypothetical protein|nr:hypothetical protein [Kineosporiaceae bacterium]MBK7623238.1 hypothetical protein [Kineosporiaceae bacterium]MBK8074810.1 hypothetical protein [Kineosporiaceae bacterium]